MIFNLAATLFRVTLKDIFKDKKWGAQTQTHHCFNIHIHMNYWKFALFSCNPQSLQHSVRLSSEKRTKLKQFMSLWVLQNCGVWAPQFLSVNMTINIKLVITQPNTTENTHTAPVSI